MKATNLEIQTYYNDYSKLTGKFEKGAFIDDTAFVLGVDRSTVYRWFNRLSKGKLQRTRSDKHKPRKKGVTPQIKEMVAKKVAALKIETATKTGKVLKTEMAIIALYNAGEIPEKYNEATVNRWLNELGLSFRQINKYNEVTNNRLVAARPNQWWFVDSSVSELYYLKNNLMKRDNTGILTDKNHREERLTEKGYRKLLIFCAVDLYSHAWFVKAYVTPGESTASWTRFLMDAFSAKEGIPLRGIPENIYSDKGSGLKGHQTMDMFDNLGINFEAHFPGNAKAKGLVERRIGLYKNNIESALRFEDIYTIERYNEITTQLMIEENTKAGRYQLWSDIYKLGILKEFTEDFRRKVCYSTLERVVNVYGCVSIDKKEYFVSNRLHKERVTIYRRIDGTITAIDKNDNRYCVTEADQNVEMGKYKSRPKTEYDETLAEVQQLGKDLRKKIKPENFIEGSTKNIVHFSKPGTVPEITTPFDKKAPIETIEEAWYQIYLETRVSKKELPPEKVSDLDRLMWLVIESDGGIKSEMFNSICEMVINTIIENYKEEAL